MRAVLLALPLALSLAACKTPHSELPLGTPPLSLVGEGLVVERTEVPTSFVRGEAKAFHSIYSAKGNDLFRDLRARKVGDVVTVIIDINDKAQFDNQSGRSRERAAKGSFAASLGFGGFGVPEQGGEAAGDLDLSGSTRAKGEGSIGRSEKLRLSIAAVVVEILPGGNLLISGSQEVRVNKEVRVLNIAGIVRTLDIGSDNVVTYEKIAEARVAYGGRGKISEFQ